MKVNAALCTDSPASKTVLVKTLGNGGWDATLRKALLRTKNYGGGSIPLNRGKTLNIYSA